MAIEHGLSEKLLGVLFSVTVLLSALGSHFYPKIKQKLGTETLIIFISFSLGITVIISPFVDLVLGTTIIAFRYIF